MNKLLILFALLLALTACNFNYKFRDITEFKITPEALPNHDQVKVLYFSGYPEFKKDKKCFIYYIVVSKTSGDTVRILAPRQVILENRNNTKFYIALNSADSIDKFVSRMTSEDTSALRNSRDLKKTDLSPFRKVVSNKKYLNVEAKPYKTVIGYLVDELEINGIQQIPKK